MKAEVEATVKEKKLELEYKEAELRKNLRREGVENSGKIDISGVSVKLTEKSLDEAIILDEGIRILKKNVYTAERDLSIVDSLFWSVSAKDKKLNHLIKSVTPVELEDEIINCTLNSIVIRKHKNKLH